VKAPPTWQEALGPLSAKIGPDTWLGRELTQGWEECLREGSAAPFAARGIHVACELCDNPELLTPSEISAIQEWAYAEIPYVFLRFSLDFLAERVSYLHLLNRPEEEAEQAREDLYATMEAAMCAWGNYSVAEACTKAMLLALEPITPEWADAMGSLLTEEARTSFISMCEPHYPPTPVSE